MKVVNDIASTSSKSKKYQHKTKFINYNIVSCNSFVYSFQCVLNNAKQNGNNWY